MTSIIDRKDIQKLLTDPMTDHSEFDSLRVEFLKARTEYKSNKQAYNGMKRHRILRMNTNSLTILSKMYEDLKKSRTSYYVAKRKLTMCAIATFTRKISLRMTKNEMAVLGSKLIELYKSSEISSNEIVEFSIHTDLRGRIL